MTASHLKTLIEAIAETLGISYIYIYLKEWNMSNIVLIVHILAYPVTGNIYVEIWGPRKFGNTKSSSFWDITPCSHVKVNRPIPSIHRVEWQAVFTARFMLVSCFAYLEDGSDMFFRNICWTPPHSTALYARRWRFSEPHCVNLKSNIVLNISLHSEEPQLCLWKWRHVTSRCLK
jgi:hypothetical protein